jgi:cytochrome c556
LILELAIPAVMQLVQSLIPSLPTAGAGVVASTIEVLTQWGPLAVKEYKALKPVYDDAVEALEANDRTTVDQIKALRALVAIDDAEFDAALAKSRSED